MRLNRFLFWLMVGYGVFLLFLSDDWINSGLWSIAGIPLFMLFRVPSRIFLGIWLFIYALLVPFLVFVHAFSLATVPGSGWFTGPGLQICLYGSLVGSFLLLGGAVGILWKWRGTVLWSMVITGLLSALLLFASLISFAYFVSSPELTYLLIQGTGGSVMAISTWFATVRFSKYDWND